MKRSFRNSLLALIASGAMMVGCGTGTNVDSSSSSSTTSSSTPSSSSNGGSSSSSSTSSSSSSSSVTYKDGTVDITSAPKVYTPVSYSKKDIASFLTTAFGDSAPSLSEAGMTNIIDILEASYLSNDEVSSLFRIISDVLGVYQSMNDATSYKTGFHILYTDLSSFVQKIDGDKIGYFFSYVLSIRTLTSSSSTELVKGFNFPTDEASLEEMTTDIGSTNAGMTFLAPFKEMIEAGAKYIHTGVTESISDTDKVVLGRAIKTALSSLLSSFSETDLSNIALLLFGRNITDTTQLAAISAFQSSLMLNPTGLLNKLGLTLSGLDFTEDSWDAIIQAISDIIILTNKNSSSSTLYGANVLDKTYLNDIVKAVSGTTDVISGKEMRSLMHLLTVMLSNITINEWTNILSIVASSVVVDQAYSSTSAEGSLLKFYDKCFAMLSATEQAAITSLLSDAVGLDYDAIYLSLKTAIELGLSSKEGQAEMSTLMSTIMLGVITKFQVSLPYEGLAIKNGRITVGLYGMITSENIASRLVFVNGVTETADGNVTATQIPLTADSISELTYNTRTLGTTTLSCTVNLGTLGSRVIEAPVDVVPNTFTSAAGLYEGSMYVSGLEGSDIPYISYESSFLFEKGTSLGDGSDALIRANTVLYSYNATNLSMDTSYYAPCSVPLSSLDFSKTGKHYFEADVSATINNVAVNTTTFIPYYVVDEGSLSTDSVLVDNMAYLTSTTINPNATLYGYTAYSWKEDGVSKSFANYGAIKTSSDIIALIDNTTTGAKSINDKIGGIDTTFNYYILPFVEDEIAYCSIVNVDYQTEYSVGDPSFVVTEIDSYVRGKADSYYYTDTTGLRYECAETILSDKDPMSSVTNITDFNTEAAGEKIVTFSYHEIELGVTITVNEVQIAQ